MEPSEQLVGVWVEIQERSDEGRLVLMRPDADVPPTRGGRRQLELVPKGNVYTKAQGATDRLEEQAEGDWSVSKDNTLQLNLKGWEGDFTIETLSGTELILNRR